MQTIETGQPRLGVYVSAMPLMTKPWRGIAALLAAGVVAACSPGAAPVSQSPNDPSNPHAPEGVAAPGVPAPPVPPPPGKGTDPSSHRGHGATSDAGHGK